MKRYFPSAVFIVLLLLFWQLGAGHMNAAYILPTPVGILEKLWELREPLFMIHLPATLKVTAIGLVISVILGIALAVLMDASAVVERALLLSLHRLYQRQPLHRCLLCGSAMAYGVKLW